MTTTYDNSQEPVDLDRVIAQLIVDARSDDEQFRAVHRAFRDGGKAALTDQRYSLRVASAALRDRNRAISSFS